MEISTGDSQVPYFFDSTYRQVYSHLLERETIKRSNLIKFEK